MHRALKNRQLYGIGGGKRHARLRDGNDEVPKAIHLRTTTRRQDRRRSIFGNHRGTADSISGRKALPPIEARGHGPPSEVHRTLRITRGRTIARHRITVSRRVRLAGGNHAQPQIHNLYRFAHIAESVALLMQAVKGIDGCCERPSVVRDIQFISLPPIAHVNRALSHALQTLGGKLRRAALMQWNKVSSRLSVALPGSITVRE